MNQNPYAPPAADIDVAGTGTGTESGTATASQEAPALFPVGTQKLLVMSVVTIGLYAIYWFERQYQFQRRARAESIRPLARALFSIFYARDLFKRVEYAAHRAHVSHGWTATGMAGAFIASVVMGRILDNMIDTATPGAAGAVVMLARIAMLFGIAYPLVRVQGTVNQVLDGTNPTRQRNENFTPWNWLLIVIGGGFLVLAVWGSYLPNE